MGYGDELMGAGIARGAAARGRRIAFGDGRRIIWNAAGHAIYRGNPNVAPPGSEGADDLEWIAHYPNCRLYAQYTGGRWVFDPSWRCKRGEVYFDAAEIGFAQGVPTRLVIIEPHNKPKAVGNDNKTWGFAKYVDLVKRLVRDGVAVGQFDYGAPIVPGARPIVTGTFRQGLAVLARSSLYVGPEGGLSHGAAAVGIRAVVIFGAFNSPSVVGYDDHVNLFVGEGVGCGAQQSCAHCRAAMDAISVDQVFQSVKDALA